MPFLKRRALLAGAAALPFLPRLARAASPLPAVAEKDAVIAFGHIGPVSDGGWSTTHHTGLLAAKKAYPAAKFLEVESIPVSADATRTFRQFVENGANMVFVSSEYGDLLSSVADDAPEVAFLECNGHHVSDNESWYYIQHWKVSYIIGVAAAKMSKSGKMGFVGSFPVPSVFGCANAFLLGARSVRPEATVQVILINSWFDPQAAAQAASALIQNGIDMIYTNLDDGSCLQVAAKAGIKCATWNTDMRAMGPDAYVTSLMLDWTQFYVDQIGARLAGRWAGDGHTLLPVGHGVDRDAWGRTVPPEVAAQADAVRTRIIGGWNPIQGEIRDATGKVRVPKGGSLDDIACYEWNWPVEGVVGLKAV
ncbi:BMP family ABC transporter substrate-binding protein [Acetobacteraceae bacterium KSS8]|uniref:BMP family ABC transporter substrate-binding protein n=1 Tax=Endosaccharibacter trunci TaxID=2812733 RepID=A0ABT1WBH0_9PROT|nr:BMP family ABC transporter substrate-binding protein [Acetobacteraceae bacterium KSS8]